MRPDLSTMLDEALERLRSGASIEECLRAYPDHAAELEPMLRTAVAIQRQASADLPASLEQWLASGRSEIEELARIRYARRETLTGRIAAGFQALFHDLFRRGGARMASAVLSALIICALGFYTVDSAAASSLPGDYLYGWKLFSEQARIGLAANPDRRAQLVAASVERRVAEIGALSERGQADPAQLAQIVERLDSQVQQAHDALDEASPEVRERAFARIGRLLVRAESDLRGATDEGQPATEAIESAAANVADMIETLPNEPPTDAAAAIVPAPNATPESIQAAQPSPQQPAGGAVGAPTSTAPELASPISAPAEDSTPLPPTAGQLPIPSATPQPSPSPSPAASTTQVVLNTAVPTRSATPAPSRTAVATLTRTPAPSPTSVVILPPPTLTPAVPTPTATSTGAPIVGTPVAPTITSTSAPTVTNTPEPSATGTPEPSATATLEPTATNTPEPTDTPRPTATNTPEPTDTPRPTATNTPEPTDTPRPTATNTPEPSATPEPTATGEVEDPEGRLRPLLECVARVSDNVYIAYFGYRNTTSSAIDIPIGEDNRFAPEPIDRGQPTYFPVGRSERYPNALFSVVFDGERLVWKLGTSIATASRNSRDCTT